MFMEKSLCDSHGKCVFSPSGLRRRRFADVCKFFCDDSSLTNFSRCVKHRNQHRNVFVFSSHISQLKSGFGNPLRSPGIASCALWLMGKLVSWIWNVWNVLRFFSLSSHLCYDINQMPELAAALSLRNNNAWKFTLIMREQAANIITSRILIHIFASRCFFARCLAYEAIKHLLFLKWN